MEVDRLRTITTSDKVSYLKNFTSGEQITDLSFEGQNLLKQLFLE